MIVMVISVRNKGMLIFNLIISLEWFEKKYEEVFRLVYVVWLI